MRTVQQLKDEFGIVQNLKEFQALIDIVKYIKPNFIIEIGVERGGSLQAWSDCLDHGHLIGIDTQDIIIWEKFYKNANTFKFIKGDSSSDNTIDCVYSFINTLVNCPSHVDFLFIDGDHTYEGVAKDYENYHGLVREGGIIAFHDIKMDLSGKSGVTKFWNEVKQLYSQHKEIHEENNGIGIGVLYKV